MEYLTQLIWIIGLKSNTLKNKDKVEYQAQKLQAEFFASVAKVSLTG